MTTHEFAKQLLDGPDIVILVPKCLEYDDNPDGSCANPLIAWIQVQTDGVTHDAALISYSSDQK